MLHTTMVCHAINTALLSHSNTKEVQQSLKFPQLKRFISRPYFALILHCCVCLSSSVQNVLWLKTAS